MPGLFEQFPHTNLHELNLDWIIDMINQFKEELEDSAVLSVNGQTGHVTLYESENVILPPLPEGTDQWRLVRLVDGQYVGIMFYNNHAYLQRGNETMRLLTLEDIPTSAGVVSWNGLTGVVNVSGQDINVSPTNPVPIASAIATINDELSNKLEFFNSTQPVTDANSGTDSSTDIIFRTNIETLHTPYAEGLTPASDSIIININASNDYNTQVSIISGSNDIFIRRKNLSGWSSWFSFVKSAEIKNIVQGTFDKNTALIGSGSVRVEKIGRMGLIEGYLQPTALIANGNQLGTMSLLNRDGVNHLFVAVDNYSGKAYSLYIEDGTGNIKSNSVLDIPAMSGTKYLTFTTVFFTD